MVLVLVLDLESLCQAWRKSRWDKKKRKRKKKKSTHSQRLVQITTRCPISKSKSNPFLPFLPPSNNTWKEVRRTRQVGSPLSKMYSLFNPHNRRCPVRQSRTEPNPSVGKSLAHHHRWLFNLLPLIPRQPGSETGDSARNLSLPIPRAAHQLRP